MQKICILLSTYNGSKYLKEQLDSIFFQSYKNFQVIVRDDGSSDTTAEILKSYNIKILDNYQNLGAKGSFFVLLEYALHNIDAEYFIFCDQDDVWYADKVEKTYQKMQELENIYGKDMPLLVHNDLTVVDERLDIIAPSFWKYQHIDPSKDSLNRLLLHNTVTGCTMMINRSLAEKVKTIPPEAIMHDWWMAMVASAFGKIGYIDEPLMLYRQHGTNDTGAKNYGWGYFIKKFRERPRLDRYLIQAEMFLSMYEDKLDDNSKGMLVVLKDFNSFSKFKKIQVIIKYRLWKNGFIRNVGLLVNA